MSRDRSRRCCVLFSAPAPRLEAPKRTTAAAQPAEGPEGGHTLVGGVATWMRPQAGANGAGGDDGARGGAAGSSGRGAAAAADAPPEYESLTALRRRRAGVPPPPPPPPPTAASNALVFAGLPPLNADALAGGLADAVGACLGTAPRAASSTASMDGLEDQTPAPDSGPVGPPDSQVLAEELRREGVRLVKAGQAAAAEIVYTEALKYAPRMHMLYSNRAACYARLGRHADALNDARTCISLAPGACRGHWQEALALEAQGRYAEALRAYERACTVARESGADPALVREYEARREGLRRTTASQQDAAARVARILADDKAKAQRSLFGRAPAPAI